MGQAGMGRGKSRIDGDRLPDESKRLTPPAFRAGQDVAMALVVEILRGDAPCRAATSRSLSLPSFRRPPFVSQFLRNLR
jgi:hypothetical protein